MSGKEIMKKLKNDLIFILICEMITNETMDNPAYPLELFQRVITVSLETMKIVRSLPKLDID